MTERSQSCPPGISLVPHLSTGVAFNNFDRFVETTSGKDTLHDTVGIIYQFVEPHNPSETSPEVFNKTQDKFISENETDDGASTSDSRLHGCLQK